MEAAEREGSAAVTYEGLMVDYAMVTAARELLALADTIEARSGGGGASAGERENEEGA